MCGRPDSDTFPPSCECSDGSAWSLPLGPCANGSYDIQSFTCTGEGTVGFEERCPKGEKRTGGTCNDLTTFNFNLPTPQGGRGGGGRGGGGRGSRGAPRRGRGGGK